MNHLTNEQIAHLTNEIFNQLTNLPINRSTNYDLFMQNKANLLETQMNVSAVKTKEYENISNWTLGKNKPKTNPIKANLRKAKMNVNSLITKDYRKKDAFAVQKNKPNSNPVLSAVEWANFRKGQNERKRFFTKGL